MGLSPPQDLVRHYEHHQCVNRFHTVSTPFWQASPHATPILPRDHDTNGEPAVLALITQMQPTQLEAQDNLLTTKIR